MNNKRLFLSLSEEDVKKLDSLRAEFNMNRSQYIRYILSDQKRIIMPTSIKQKELVQQLAQIDLHLKAISFKDGLETKDVLYIYETLKDIRNVLDISSCQVNQKIERGEIFGKDEG